MGAAVPKAAPPPWPQFIAEVNKICEGVSTAKWWSDACKNGPPVSPPNATPFPVDGADRLALARHVVMNDFLLESGSLTVDGTNTANTRLAQLHYVSSACVAPPVCSRFLVVHEALGVAVRHPVRVGRVRPRSACATVCVFVVFKRARRVPRTCGCLATDTAARVRRFRWGLHFFLVPRQERVPAVTSLCPCPHRFVFVRPAAKGHRLPRQRLGNLSARAA